MPGLSGPIPSVNLTIIAYPGTAHFRAGKRTPQRHPYAPFFPVLQYNQDSRALLRRELLGFTRYGILVRNPDAEQAQVHPWTRKKWASPTLPAWPSACNRPHTGLCLSKYGAQGSLNIKFPHTPRLYAIRPVGLRVPREHNANSARCRKTAPKPEEVYGPLGASIDSYEQSVQVSAFSSKFDAFLAGKYKLTADEMAGFELFNGKGNCNSCHLDGRGTALSHISQHQQCGGDCEPSSVHLFRLGQ